MEKGIEAEEDNLYKQTEEVAENVLDSLNGIKSNVKVNTNIPNVGNSQVEINYNKMADAFLNALNKCKLTLDEDGFARLVKNELYEVI